MRTTTKRPSLATSLRRGYDAPTRHDTTRPLRVYIAAAAAVRAYRIRSATAAAAGSG